MLRNLLRSTIVKDIFAQAKRTAGHSKWANIKHAKGLKDAQRGMLFTKLSRQIKVAITEGGSADPKMNLKLEQVIEQTRRANMPAATVQNIIKSCKTDKSQCKMYTLEIKGPGSCIILCEIFTEHLHVVKQLVATILKKLSLKFSDGGGRHLFDQKGIVVTEVPAIEGKDVFEMATDDAIESGAEDVRLEEGELHFICGATNLKSVVDQLEKRNYVITSGTVEYFALKCQELDEDQLETCRVLYDKLEALPEVIKLSDNIA